MDKPGISKANVKENLGINITNWEKNPGISKAYKPNSSVINKLSISRVNKPGIGKANTKKDSDIDRANAKKI